MAKTGRPTKYDPDTMLPILQELAERGAFLEEVPHELGITKTTLYRWLDPDGDFYAGEEFCDSIKAIEAGRDRWLMKHLRSQVEGTSEGNASTLIFALKNTVGWRDRSEVETTNTNRNIVIED